ncbi:MAG: hypothetical protein V1839_00245 [archaeon]
MDKDSIITQMFNSGLIEITHNYKGMRVNISSNKLALNPRILNVFIDDLVQKIQGVQAVSELDLKLMALVPESLFLSSAIARKLDTNIEPFDYKDNRVERIEPNSDYIFIGCFIAGGDTLCAAHEKLIKENSRVAHAIYVLNKEMFDTKINDYGINVHSSIALSDILDVYKRRII